MLSIAALAVIVGSIALYAMSDRGTRIGKFRTEPVYFRLVVDLEFEKAPFTIDVVVACSQHRTQSRAYGGTNETLGMSAYVFAVRLLGDHAVKVRTIGAPGAPNPCSGDTTANGRVPKDWLPLVVWYDRADDLSHGLGYADQVAYASPIAKLDFRGARVEKATAEDFERFLQTGPKNLVPPYLSGIFWGNDHPVLGGGGAVPAQYLAHPEKAWMFAPHPMCRGVRRVRLSGSQRETVRALWPKERPDRWQPPRSVENDLKRRIRREAKQGDRPESYNQDRGSSGPMSDDTVFPVLTNDTLQGLKSDPGQAEAYAHDALVNETPSLRGFVYCDSEAPPELIEALLKRPPDRFGLEARRKCRIDGMDVRVSFGGCDDSAWIVFERDEYAFFFYTGAGA